jgi:gluconolactonase
MHLRIRRALIGWLTIAAVLFFGAVPIVVLAEEPSISSVPPARIERLDARLDALVAPDAAVTVFAEGIEWAEGPLWDRGQQALLFSDVPRNGIFRVRAAGQPPELWLARSGYTGSAPFTGREPGSNGLTFDADGRLVFCRHGDRGIARREADGRIVVLADRFEGRRLNSPNDLVYRSTGDLYFTDPPFGLARAFDDPAKELPFQGVYRLARDGRLEALVRDLEAPNGIGFSPDERTLYVANAFSARPIWMAYPVRGDGTLGPGRQFAEARAYVAPGEGVPDGLKVDTRGNIFATGPGGVHIFAPDGTRLGRIVTDVPTGNVAFGAQGSTFFIAANHRILRVELLTRAKLAGR